MTKTREFRLWLVAYGILFAFTVYAASIDYLPIKVLKPLGPVKIYSPVVAGYDMVYNLNAIKTFTLPGKGLRQLICDDGITPLPDFESNAGPGQTLDVSVKIPLKQYRGLCKFRNTITYPMMFPFWQVKIVRQVFESEPFPIVYVDGCKGK